MHKLVFAPIGRIGASRDDKYESDQQTSVDEWLQRQVVDLSMVIKGRIHLGHSP